MTRVLCTALTLLLLAACGAEKQQPPPAAPLDRRALSPSPAPDTTAPPAQTAYDITGAYFPIDPLPADFAELEHLLLATIDENAAPAPLNGFLRPKSRTAEDYTLIRPSLTGSHLTFETESHGGVRYAFDGEFAVLGNFAENPPAYETVVLSGTLRRIRGEETVASTPVRFRYEAGG